MEQYNYSKYKNAYYPNIFHTLLIVTGRPYVHFFTPVEIQWPALVHFFLNTSLFSYSVRTTNLFGLFLIMCTLISPIIHKHQNTISKFFLHQNVIYLRNMGIFFAFYMIQSLNLKFYNVIGIHVIP